MITHCNVQTTKHSPQPEIDLVELSVHADVANLAINVGFIFRWRIRFGDLLGLELRHGLALLGRHGLLRALSLYLSLLLPLSFTFFVSLPLCVLWWQLHVWLSSCKFFCRERKQCFWLTKSENCFGELTACCTWAKRSGFQSLTMHQFDLQINLLSVTICWH